MFPHESGVNDSFTSTDAVKEETDHEEERVPYTRYSPSSSRRGKSPGFDFSGSRIPIKSLYEDDELSVPVIGGTVPSLQLVKQV
jgi:hypothetical protein